MSCSVIVENTRSLGLHAGEEVLEFKVATENVYILCNEFGATISSVFMKDRNGVEEEISLCYSNLPDIVSEKNPYYGCAIGRVANRICKGKFSLNGVNYQLAVNNGPNHLHGGIRGFNKCLWKSKIIIGGVSSGVQFSLTSPDGDEGYPGTVEVTVTYLLTSSNELIIDYKATSSEQTPINLTNHTYWNLSGNFKDKVLGHKLQLSSDHYLPVDVHSIPTGDVTSVNNTPYDFTTPALLGDRIPVIDGGGEPGIDHCFVVNNNTSAILQSKTTDEIPLKHMATLSDEKSGRQIALYGSQPGVQVYTGNFLSKDDSCFPHTQHNAICLETQHFPDSVNQPHFPTTILSPDTRSHAQVCSFLRENSNNRLNHREMEDILTLWDQLLIQYRGYRRYYRYE
eukprot:gene2369-4598_t